MRGFKFRLHAVQKLRDRQRDERRSALAEAYRAEQALAQQRNQVDEEIGAATQHATDAKQGEVDIDRLIAVQQYEVLLQAQRTMIDDQMKQLDEEIDRRRKALAEADREVRLIEKLYDRQARRHRQEVEKQEAKTLDEVAVQAAARGESQSC